MRYDLHSELPIHAFKPRLSGPFGRGMTLEGGGGGFNPIAIVTDPISKVLGTDGSGGGILGGLAKIDPGPAIGKGLAEFDKSVGKVIPGGWTTVAAVASMVAAPHISAYLAAQTGMSAVAASTVTGAGLGAATGAASGQGAKGIITGAVLGGLGGGLGEYLKGPAQFSAADFVAEDAFSMARQGLSAEQIAYNLQAAGVEAFAAADAGQLAARGLSVKDLAQNLAIGHGDKGLFIPIAGDKIKQAVAEGYKVQGDLVPESSTPFDSATTARLRDAGVNSDMVLDFGNSGIYDADTILNASENGFTSASQYRNATDMGFTNRFDYDTAFEQGYTRAADFQAGRAAGFSDIFEYEQALLNGGFDDTSMFNDAITRGFRDAGTYEDAVLNGFTTADQYATATNLGYRTAEDFAQGTLGNFSDANDYFEATRMGYDNASDFSEGLLGGYDNAQDFRTAGQLGYANNSQYQLGLAEGAQNADDLFSRLGMTAEQGAALSVGGAGTASGFNTKNILAAVAATQLAPAVLQMLGIVPKPGEFTMPQQQWMPIPTYTAQGLVDPGVSPGMISAAQFYGDQQPGVNEYYWGKQGYVNSLSGIGGLQNRQLNTIGAPVDPYGNPNAMNLGRLVTPTELGYPTPQQLQQQSGPGQPIGQPQVLPQNTYQGLSSLNTAPPPVAGFAGAFEPATQAQMALGQSPTQQYGASLGMVGIAPQLQTTNSAGFTTNPVSPVSPQQLSQQLQDIVNSFNPG